MQQVGPDPVQDHHHIGFPLSVDKRDTSSLVAVQGSPDPLLRRLIKTFFHLGEALPNLHTEVMILWRHLLAAAPAFLNSRAERPFSPGELSQRELMALSTSSSDGSAPELMTVPGRGRDMSTLVTSVAAAAAAL